MAAGASSLIPASGSATFRTPDREDSLAELARRYFAAFAPATERDFAKWSGLPLGECRVGMKRIAGELESVGPSSQGLFGPRGFDSRVPRSPVVRLLPAFDTYLMGYESRSHAVDEAGEKVILPGGGILRPTICVDGRFVGTWSRQEHEEEGRSEARAVRPHRRAVDTGDRGRGRRYRAVRES